MENTFFLQPIPKKRACQAPLYKSIADFVNMVSNHPEIAKLANYPDDPSEIDYIPFNKLDEVDKIAQFFSGEVKRRRRAATEEPTSDAASEASQERGGDEGARVTND